VQPFDERSDDRERGAARPDGDRSAQRAPGGAPDVVAREHGEQEERGDGREHDGPGSTHAMVDTRACLEREGVRSGAFDMSARGSPGGPSTIARSTCPTVPSSAKRLHYVVMDAQTNIPPPLHELEAEVMGEVWSQGEASVRAVMDALNARTKKPRAYTTYMTIMARLHTKALLLRRREGKTDFYRPAYSREEYADLRAQAGVDSLVEQYGDVALGHFARQMAQLDPERRRQLQRLARRK
jgi:predicted transcriptional regulator